jgi:hypothetical protein
MKKSKYQQKIRGIIPSNAPWGFALGSLKKTTITLHQTNHIIKVINLGNGFTSDFKKPQIHGDPTTF